MTGGVISPIFVQKKGTIDAAWLPVKWTRSLTGDEDFPNLFDRYEALIVTLWHRTWDIELEAWQIWLLRHITELYPVGHRFAGQLRLRQWVISIPRQNGKTEVAAILAIIFLMWGQRRGVYGIAATVDQAGINYDRVLDTIRNNRDLKKHFVKTTETRGIKMKKNRNLFKMRPASRNAFQGYPVSVALIDELHLVEKNLWTAAMSGTGQRSNTSVGGFSTAGDDDSEALLWLYKLGEQALITPVERNDYGFFVWESENAFVPEDDEDLWRELLRSNPSCVTGRRDKEITLSDMRKLPDEDVVRFHLNRFVSSTGDLFNMSLWFECRAPFPYTFPTSVHQPHIAIDMTPERSWATISLAVKVDDGTEAGVVHTRLLGSVEKPSQDTLIRIVQACFNLYNPAQFIVDGTLLKELGMEIKQRGMPVRILALADQTTVASVLYARLARKTVVHAADQELGEQLPRSKRRNVGDKWRISREDSSFEIDAVEATAMAVYGADMKQTMNYDIIF